MPFFLPGIWLLGWSNVEMGQFLSQSKQKWEMLCCSIMKRDPTFQRPTLFSRVKRSLLFSPSVLFSRVKESLLFSPSALSSRVKTVVIFQPRNFVSERNLLKCFSIFSLDLYTMSKTVKMNRSEDGQTWEQEERVVTPCSRVKTVPILESWNFAFWETFAQSHAPFVSGKRWDGRPRRMRGVVFGVAVSLDNLVWWPSLWGNNKFYLSASQTLLRDWWAQHPSGWWDVAKPGFILRAHSVGEWLHHSTSSGCSCCRRRWRGSEIIPSDAAFTPFASERIEKFDVTVPKKKNRWKAGVNRMFSCLQLSPFSAWMNSQNKPPGLPS